VTEIPVYSFLRRAVSIVLPTQSEGAVRGHLPRRPADALCAGFRKLHGANFEATDRHTPSAGKIDTTVKISGASSTDVVMGSNGVVSEDGPSAEICGGPWSPGCWSPAAMDIRQGNWQCHVARPRDEHARVGKVTRLQERVDVAKRAKEGSTVNPRDQLKRLLSALDEVKNCKRWRTGPLGRAGI